MKYIYRNGGFTVSMMEDEPVAALKNETARCLMDAIDTTRISERIPEDMLRKLREDIFVFSGCKSYHELKEASQLLLDEEFRIKPFQRFRQDVLDIYPKYNQRYLEAEYEFAIASSQTAAQWSELTEQGDTYDLQYRTAGDDAVRPEHARLDGVTLPASDSFWASYMPPNGWRCRCSVRQVLAGKYVHTDHSRAIQLGEKATTDNDSLNRNRAEMFRFNPGLQQVVFPPSHPYYRNVPEEVKNIANE